MLGESLKLKWLTGLFIFIQNYRQAAVNNYAPGVLSTNILVPVNATSPLEIGRAHV